MNTRHHLPVFLLLLLTLTGFAAANDVPSSTDGNECYAGGVMEGKCNDDFNGDGTISQSETDWAWNCGWYLWQFNHGLLAAEGVPDWCGSLLSANGPTFFQLTSGSYTYRLTGNLIQQDSGNDGSYEHSWYIMSNSVPGDGLVCPAGTSYSAEIVDYIYSLPDFYLWITGFGFNNNDDLCLIL